MKILRSILLVAITLSIFVGCKAMGDLQSADNATGKPYELVLVCAQPEWQSELGDTLESVLKQPV